MLLRSSCTSSQWPLGRTVRISPPLAIRHRFRRRIQFCTWRLLAIQAAPPDSEWRQSAEALICRVARIGFSARREARPSDSQSTRPCQLEPWRQCTTEDRPLTGPLTTDIDPPHPLTPLPLKASPPCPRRSIRLKAPFRCGFLRTCWGSLVNGPGNRLQIFLNLE